MSELTRVTTEYERQCLEEANDALRAQLAAVTNRAEGLDERLGQLMQEKDDLQRKHSAAQAEVARWKQSAMMLKECACSWEPNPNPDDEYTGGPHTDKIESLCQAHKEYLESRTARLLSLLEKFVELTNESHGVMGWHLNGDLAKWDEFDFVDEAQQALAEGKACES